MGQTFHMRKKVSQLFLQHEELPGHLCIHHQFLGPKCRNVMGFSAADELARLYGGLSVPAKSASLHGHCRIILGQFQLHMAGAGF